MDEMILLMIGTLIAAAIFFGAILYTIYKITKLIVDYKRDKNGLPRS